MSKIYQNINDEKPVRAYKRKPAPAAIPPATFPDALEVIKTGVWPPPRSILLTGVTVTARMRGSANAELIIYRLDAPEQPTALTEITLEANEVRTIADDRQNAQDPNIRAFTLPGQDPPIIGPFEPIFISSEKYSGHIDVIVQLIGEYI